MNWYIFRHAMTLQIKNGTGYGKDQETAAILDEGKPAIVEMSKFLKDITESKNFTSPLLRCRQTVEIVTQITGKEFIVDQRISEKNLDDGFDEFKKKVSQFAAEVESMNLDNIVICTNGPVITTLNNLLLYKTSEWLDEYYPMPGQLLIFKNNIRQLVDFN